MLAFIGVEMFGSAIRRFREKKGLTMAELGELIGVSHTTISRYERGSRTPSAEKLRDIAQALGVSVSEMVDMEKAIKGEILARPDLIGFVSSETDSTRWRDMVLSDHELDPWVQMILVALPIFMDRISWVVPITIDQFIEETGRSKEIVKAHWGAVSNSKYVDRVGKVEWVFRLRIP